MELKGAFMAVERHFPPKEISKVSQGAVMDIPQHESLIMQGHIDISAYFLFFLIGIFHLRPSDFWA
ncbi:MAG: hypothetical protein KGL26_10755 [Pseudomonadota bacterium]|nr:hypothetical protein [Pseudomonadota bacterium]